MLSRKVMAILAMTGIGAAGACQGPTDAPPLGADLEALGADHMLTGMVSFLSASGVREGRIEADTAYVYVDSATTSLRGMRLIFYNEQGRPRATVTSESGELDDNTDRMVARGNVVLTVHQDGRRIESPELHYDPGRDRLWSDSATVQILPDGSVTRGTSFESDLEFQNFRLANPRGSISGIRF